MFANWSATPEGQICSPEPRKKMTLCVDSATKMAIKTLEGILHNHCELEGLTMVRSRCFSPWLLTACSRRLGALSPGTWITAAHAARQGQRGCARVWFGEVARNLRSMSSVCRLFAFVVVL